MNREKPPLTDRVHSILVRALGIKERDFSHESVDRAMAALNAVRAPAEPLVAEVLWLNAPTAFTLPGRYLYVSRRLLERCKSDAPMAFALAHEAAHHDLGHLSRGNKIFDAVARGGRFQLIVNAASLLAEQIYSRDQELAADAYALETCRKAGFVLVDCLRCFDILMEYALDHRDIEGVYGADADLELDPDLAANAFEKLFIEAHIWRARHSRSHPSIVEPLEILKKPARA